MGEVTGLEVGWLGVSGLSPTQTPQVAGQLDRASLLHQQWPSRETQSQLLLRP